MIQLVIFGLNKFVYIGPKIKGSTYKKKQKENMVKSQITDISHLPSELILNILSRLPLTSLLGSAKYTCKLWHSATNAPIFSDMHFAHALINPPGYLYAHSSNNLYFTDNPTLALKLPGDLTDEIEYESVASCRGLISYWHTQDKSIYLCNPILGDQVQIPSPKNLPMFAWGFGYAPLTKQYKYLYFSSPNPHPDNSNPLPAKIFTLGGQSWRDLAFPHNYIWRKFVYCNGALYWKLASPVSEYCFMSLDLDTENFRLRRLPIVTGDYLMSSLYPAVFGKTVAVVIQTRNRIQEVWMPVDEAEDIWIKKYSFGVPASGIGSCFTPSGLWMNQDLYGMEFYFRKGPGNVGYGVCKRWLLYNVDSKTYTDMQFPLAEDADTKADGGAPWLVITHVGSLISPLKFAKAAVNPTCLVKR